MYKTRRGEIPAVRKGQQFRESQEFREQFRGRILIQRRILTETEPVKHNYKEPVFFLRVIVIGAHDMRIEN